MRIHADCVEVVHHTVSVTPSPGDGYSLEHFALVIKETSFENPKMINLMSAKSRCTEICGTVVS